MHRKTLIISTMLFGFFMLTIAPATVAIPEPTEVATHDANRGGPGFALTGFIEGSAHWGQDGWAGWVDGTAPMRLLDADYDGGASFTIYPKASVKAGCVDTTKQSFSYTSAATQTIHPLGFLTPDIYGNATDQYTSPTFFTNNTRVEIASQIPSFAGFTIDEIQPYDPLNPTFAYEATAADFANQDGERAYGDVVGMGVCWSDSIVRSHLTLKFPCPIRDTAPGQYRIKLSVWLDNRMSYGADYTYSPGVIWPGYPCTLWQIVNPTAGLSWNFWTSNERSPLSASDGTYAYTAGGTDWYRLDFYCDYTVGAGGSAGQYIQADGTIQLQLVMGSKIGGIWGEFPFNEFSFDYATCSVTYTGNCHPAPVMGGDGTNTFGSTGGENGAYACFTAPLAWYGLGRTYNFTAPDFAGITSYSFDLVKITADRYYSYTTAGGEPAFHPTILASGAVMLNGHLMTLHDTYATCTISTFNALCPGGTCNLNVTAPAPFTHVAYQFTATYPHFTKVLSPIPYADGAGFMAFDLGTTTFQHVQITSYQARNQSFVVQALVNGAIRPITSTLTALLPGGLRLYDTGIDPGLGEFMPGVPIQFTVAVTFDPAPPVISQGTVEVFPPGSYVGTTVDFAAPQAFLVVEEGSTGRFVFEVQDNAGLATANLHWRRSNSTDAPQTLVLDVVQSLNTAMGQLTFAIGTGPDQFQLDASFDFWASFMDRAGNLNTTSARHIFIAHETVPSTIMVLEPAAGTVYGQDLANASEVSVPELAITVEDANVDPAHVFVNLGEYASRCPLQYVDRSGYITFELHPGMPGWDNWTAQWTAQADGMVALNFSARDTRGNWNATTWYLYRDTTPPAITILHPQASDGSDGEAPYFEVTITDLTLAGAWYSLDGGTTTRAISLAHPYGLIDQTLFNAAYGPTTTITFFAGDMGGQVSNASVTITREDYEPPEQPLPDTFQWELVAYVGAIFGVGLTGRVYWRKRAATRLLPRK